MYGVIPIIVEDPQTRLEPVIDTSEEFAPEQPAKIAVHEKNGRPMTYTLAVVDEGLLDHRQIFIGLLVMTLFVPCMSNTMILGRIVGWLKTVFIFALVTIIALCVGIGINMLLQ